jgi:Reverse transcriptase (RNA-dependent DNA polymerase)
MELESVHSYNVFIDKGSTVPAGYRKIPVHLVFDVKHDGQHKAHLVADRHLTDVPLESVHSGVVSLQGIHILVFLSEVNKLELWATDIENAYLKATTSEEVYIITGSEYGGLKGHVLVINKALNGL